MDAINMSNPVLTDQRVTNSGIRRRCAAWCANVIKQLPANGGWKQRCLAPIRVLCESIVVGALRVEEMDQLVQETYASKPKFYDPEKYRLPYEASMLPILQHFAAPPRRMLDAFCGQGREAELFAEAGYAVTAIDREDWMIREARSNRDKRGFDAKFLVEDFGHYEPHQRFDVVYTSIWMLSTYQGQHRRVEMLSRCRQLCVGEDGLVVVSIVSDQNDSRGGLWVRYAISRMVSVLFRRRERPEFGQRFYGGLFWHHLSDEVVQSDLKAAGLTVVGQTNASGMEPVFYFLRPSSRSGG